MQHVPIDLHDQRGGARQEVHDVATDDLLAAKLHAEPLPADGGPKERRGYGGWVVAFYSPLYSTPALVGLGLLSLKGAPPNAAA